MTISFYKHNNVWIFRDVLTPPNTLMMKELVNDRVLIMDRARRTRYQGRVDNILDADGNPYENFAALYAATEDFFNDFNEPAVEQLGIDLENGSTTKYLSEKGTMEEVPGGAALLTNLTYAELAAAITGSTLTPGAKYLITDYQTVHEIPNSGILDEESGEMYANEINTGQIEPLLVTAISENELAPEAYSSLFPDDVIYYSPTNDQGMVPGCTKGYIYRRVDTKQNNDIPFDFRQVKFRRWQISQPTWDEATTYAKGAVVKSTADDVLWVSLLDGNLNNATSNTAYWREFEWNNLSYVSPFKSRWDIVNKSFRIFVTCTELYQDYKIWANAADYATCYSNKLESPKNNLISNTNTVVFGGNIYSNSIGAYFNSNSIGAYFNSNSIGAYFNSNSIGSTFNSNSIGAYFISNSIGVNFYSNSIGNSFNSNSIGANFNSNSIGAYFNTNSIVDYFNSNSIGAYFNSNSIGANFNYNSIGANFNTNSIGANFQSNSIEADFSTNSIGAGFDSNSIGANFYNNSIEANFHSNSTSANIRADFSAVTEIYNKQYPHELIVTDSGGVLIRWYDNTGAQQTQFIA